jgi:hypothetical protein
MLCLRCLAHGGTNTVLYSLLFLLSGTGTYYFFQKYHYLMKKISFHAKITLWRKILENGYLHTVNKGTIRTQNLKCRLY